MNSHDLRERNRQTVARYFEEFWTKGNVNVVDELCSDDFALFYPLHGRHEGKEAIKRMLSDYKKAFPDISFQLFSPFPLIVENEYVVARWIGGGKHTGEACFDFPIGNLPEPNSGKAMRFSGTTIYTLRDGMIVEEIGEESALLALQQLGLLPSGANS